MDRVRISPVGPHARQTDDLGNQTPIGHAGVSRTLYVGPSHFPPNETTQQVHSELALFLQPQGRTQTKLIATTQWRARAAAVALRAYDSGLFLCHTLAPTPQVNTRGRHVQSTAGLVLFEQGFIFAISHFASFVERGGWLGSR